MNGPGDAGGTRASATFASCPSRRPCTRNTSRSPFVVVVEQADARGQDLRVVEVSGRTVEVHEVETQLGGALDEPVRTDGLVRRPASILRGPGPRGARPGSRVRGAAARRPLRAARSGSRPSPWDPSWPDKRRRPRPPRVRAHGHRVPPNRVCQGVYAVLRRRRLANRARRPFEKRIESTRPDRHCATGDRARNAPASPACPARGPPRPPRPARSTAFRCQSAAAPKRPAAARAMAIDSPRSRVRAASGSPSMSARGRGRRP